MQNIHYFNESNHRFLSLTEFMGEISLNWFDSNYWRGQGTLTELPLGRGQTCQFEYNQESFILRHYCRGGIPAKISKDRYFFTGLTQSRPWQEWHILHELHQQGFPVPKPIACHLVKEHFFYRADIITQKIEQSTTLSQLLQQHPISLPLWEKIIDTIHSMHDHDIYHADLNAHNILIDAQEKVWIIDFDRAKRKKLSASNRQTNFQRLFRSLRKLNFFPQDFK